MKGSITRRWFFNMIGIAVLCLVTSLGHGASFPGTGTGPIPDGLSGTPPQYGTPQVISFNVSNLSSPVQQVFVTVTLTHSWVGDLDMVLQAPDGTTSAQIIGRVGVTTAAGFGDDSSYNGSYTFIDLATNHFWTVATNATCGDTCNVTPGNYRASARGQAAQTNPPPVVNLTQAFSQLNTSQINGTWTLTIRDAAGQDTGSTTAATLDITAGGDPGPRAPVDFDGDGRTDYAIVRNTGGGPSGQITWFTALNNQGTTQITPWGLASDYFLPADYDGDGKSDIAAWRPTNGAWYILQSSTGTIRIDQFGMIGDDPTVIGDYNGDGRDDLAVYRRGSSTGAPSYWYYRDTPGSSNFSVIQWGQNGDFPAPGDYDGDGRDDFVIQRNDGGQARFWRRYATGNADTVVFGLPTDTIVPGDYDGDFMTDIAVLRSVEGSFNWFYLPSTGGPYVQVQWGNSSTDFPTPGDYDGDGRTDIAVFQNPTFSEQCSFVGRSSATGSVFFYVWGLDGDYPLANYNVH